MAKLAIAIRYLEPHGTAYRYRRIVPADVRAKLPKVRQNGRDVERRAWLKTFPATTPLAVIERTAKRLAAEHDNIIARARAGEVLSAKVIAEAEAQAREWLKRDRSEMFETLAHLSADPTPSDRVFLNAVEHNGRYIPDGLSLSAAYARDKAKADGQRAEKPVEFAVTTFIATIGDKDIRTITRADVSDWIASLEKRTMAPATIKRRLGALRALVNRTFLDFDYAGRNPFEKHKIKKSTGGADDRLPFNGAMLEQIDAYLAAGKVRAETRNIVRMMKGTGGGPAEIGGLTLADVRLDGEIPFIWIRANAIRGVKAAVRDRRIPLVGEALDAARDAYKRASVKAKGKSKDGLRLFAGFGKSADSISAKLNKAIRSAGVPKSPRLVAYSFRHTMKEALRSAGVADHVQRRLLGHSGDGVADRYGSPHARLAEAKDAIKRALRHLGDVDDAIYGANERIAKKQRKAKKAA